MVLGVGHKESWFWGVKGPSGRKGIPTDLWVSKWETPVTQLALFCHESLVKLGNKCLPNAFLWLSQDTLFDRLIWSGSCSTFQTECWLLATPCSDHSLDQDGKQCKYMQIQSDTTTNHFLFLEGCSLFSCCSRYMICRFYSKPPSPFLSTGLFSHLKSWIAMAV